ncbi:HI1506-related protein [Trabulsiella odontotermitis]|uniref:HI1506-related protein n=1 Tax=Trabulsiella odontotermitis TaxID=379893 RepID=UPI0006769B07|nr:HI1506-related protein [Trabulsiella odontotermitis]
MPVRIASKQDGFRRCGVAHSSALVVWPDDKFTAKQLKQLQAEPMLIVDIVSDAAPEPASVLKVLTLGELIAAADLATLKLARLAINNRLVEELDVQGLLGLRAEINDALDAQGYSDPVDPAPAPGAVVSDGPAAVISDTSATGEATEQPKPEPEKAPAQPETPAKPDSDDVKPAVKSSKKSDK